MGIPNSDVRGRKIRVLLTKSILDAHDRGIKYIARKLRDAGMEVIYTQFEAPEDIANAAMQEDVDVIAISCNVGGHLGIVSDVTKSLKMNKVGNILILVGGVIPTKDIAVLEEMGVSKVIRRGAPSDEVVNYIVEGVVRI